MVGERGGRGWPGFGRLGGVFSITYSYSATGPERHRIQDALHSVSLLRRKFASGPTQS